MIPAALRFPLSSTCTVFLSKSLSLMPFRGWGADQLYDVGVETNQLFLAFPCPCSLVWLGLCSANNLRSSPTAWAYDDFHFARGWLEEEKKKKEKQPPKGKKKEEEQEQQRAGAGKTKQI